MQLPHNRITVWDKNLDTVLTLAGVMVVTIGSQGSRANLLSSVLKVTFMLARLARRSFISLTKDWISG
jgi:hypothetical protein